MSTWAALDVRCLACDSPFEVRLLKGMHITRLPAVRESIVRGTFQMFACPACGERVVVENKSVYTDFQRQDYIGVCVGDDSNWRDMVIRHQRTFDECFTLGPDVAQELGWGFRTRIVFGIDGLREKVICWGAGLDDRLVEAIKGDFLRARGIDLGAEVLRLSLVYEDGSMLFALTQPPAGYHGASAVRKRPLLNGHAPVARRSLCRAPRLI